MNLITECAVTVALLASSAGTARAWGPAGHQIVGAIADKKLAGTPTGQKVAQLIDGFTLEKASVIADEIKGWDKKGADNPGIFHYSARPRIDAQLRDFWRANPPTKDHNSAVPSHHWFHYTDVPLVLNEKYADGKAGRSQWDIVQITMYCVSVLRGETPEENERKITKPIAIILLAHYVGDIHEPMHVGAMYFDQQGHVTDPDKNAGALEDQGGNTISLQLPADGSLPAATKKLHGFWDNDAVVALLPQFPPAMAKEERRARGDAARTDLVNELVKAEPKNWRVASGTDPKAYSEIWANEILPIAREAHDRLTISEARAQQQEGGVVAIATAQPKTMPDGLSYPAWSARIARDELQKAGWRLADLLEKTVGSTSTTAAVPSSTIVPTSAYGTYPAGSKEIVSAWMKTNGFDSAKIDWQSAPKPAEVPGANGRHSSGYLVIFNTKE